MIKKDEKFDESYYREWLRYILSEERKALAQFYLRMILLKEPNIQRILDIGCGYGHFLNACLNNNIPEVYGVDVSTTAVEKPQTLKEVKVSRFDFSKEPSYFENNFFDAELKKISIVKPILFPIKVAPKILGRLFIFAVK